MFFSRLLDNFFFAIVLWNSSQPFTQVKVIQVSIEKDKTEYKERTIFLNPSMRNKKARQLHLILIKFGNMPFATAMP